MSISTEVTYVDGVTAVSAAWLNLIQEHLAGWLNITIEASGNTITIAAAPDSQAATAYIEGQLCYAESDLTFVVSGVAGTYDVFLVAEFPPAMTVEALLGSAPLVDSRKIAEVEWDGAAITELRIERGDAEEHTHQAGDPSGETLDHGDLAGRDSGDDHTQYIHVDGRRAFTGALTGVDPVSGTDLATKGYADGLVSGGVPVGTVIPFGGLSAPAGWLLCDGTSYAVATYPTLAAVLDDAYGGDGGTNFNVPDLRAAFPYGKPDSGTGSTIGDSGGDIDHAHSQVAHTHSITAHSHTVTAHTHTSPTTASGGSHTHTQSSTGSGGAHTHTGGSHTHSSGFSVGSTTSVSIGARHGSTTTVGLYAKTDLDQSGSVASHTHGDGSLTTGSGTISGFSGSTSESHAHPPSINSKTHTHGGSSIGGSTGSATGTTSSAGSHTHTNPTTGSAGSHTHSIGTTGSALTSTSSDSGGTSGSGGGDTTGTNNPAFQAVNYIIRT